MSSIRKSFTSLFLVSAIAMPGFCQTKAEAMGMVKKAIELARAQGREAALAEINKPGGAFSKGTLYVFVYDLDGVLRGHGQNPQLLGKNMLKVPDAEGALYAKECIAIAKAQGEGWQDYKFLNPVTGKVETKVAYVELFDNLVYGCGVYKPE